MFAFLTKFVFPAERYGAAGDKFSPKAYIVNPTKPMGTSRKHGKQLSSERSRS
jgi:hypothetical protein